MNIEYVWTEDNLRLMGTHYQGEETCIISIHGMSGNFIENYFAHVLGETLANQKYGFIYGHNRGYNHTNDIAQKPKDDTTNGWKYHRIGVTYELFEDSPKDISAWIQKARDLGYKRIILLGHSLGCNKVIYYLSKNKPVDIVGVILASPPDLNGLVELKKYQPNNKALLEEATRLMKDRKPRTLLSNPIWDWYTLSAQTYLSFFRQGSPADNLPVLRNPVKFEQLAVVTQPILCLMGEHDDIEINTLEKDISVIKSKATSSKDFQSEIINGANHCYENKENQFSKSILSWVRTTTKS